MTQSQIRTQQIPETLLEVSRFRERNFEQHWKDFKTNFAIGSVQIAFDSFAGQSIESGQLINIFNCLTCFIFNF